ncbi:hypothetical protein DENSPDRAFT_840528 [Dentipellis sp. KUC8613]|nr:hypothetical protein DENSPDRAFT_840528 [Dentipellis sp. KUC8613]
MASEILSTAQVQDSPSETKETSPSTNPSAAAQAVPLSFPAILRHAGLNNRFAHLLSDRPPAHPASSAAKKASRRDDNEGKRWIRRKENARFTGNPHIAAPTRQDIDPARPVTHPTFPTPLPPYLPRSVTLPPTVAPTTSVPTANAGRFSLSMRGMRRTLRKAGPRTQALVKGVEDELVNWLQNGTVVVRTEDAGPLDEHGQEFPGRIIANQEGVREVERTPTKLVWWIEDDAWARYVVHCCARYHEVVSFSKDTPTHRLTHLLRPNTSRPDRAAHAGLVTPPTTDQELTSLSSYDSDLVPSSSDIQSDGLSDILSDGDHESMSDAPPRRASLSDIASDAEGDVEAEVSSDRSPSRGSISSLYREAMEEAEAWSVEGESDLERGVESLSIHDPPSQTMGHPAVSSRYRRAVPYRNSVWNRTRSGSSPSRSPARRVGRRYMDAHLPQATAPQEDSVASKGAKSFYQYLYG